MEEIAGLPEVGKLFTGYMTDLEQARQFDRAIDQLSLDKIWNGFVEAHGFEEDSSLNKFVLAHQLGKDLVFVASLFVGIGEINSFFKIANLLKKIKGVLSIRVIRLVKKLRKNLDTNDWKKLNSLSDLNEAFLAKLDGMGDQARRLLNDFDTETLKLFVDRPGLIDSWKVLDDAREANLADRLDDIEFVDDYVNSSGKTHAQVKTAIDNADGFSAWKLANAGGNSITSFNKLSSSIASSLDNSVFTSLSSKLDNQGFIRFDNNQFIFQSPKTFLNEKSSSLYDFILDGQFYVKYDLSDGRILLTNAQDGTYYAFVQNKTPLIIQSGQNVDDVIKAHLITQTDKLKILAGLTNNRSVNVLGQVINPSTTKTTTFIGRMDDINGLKSQLGDFKNVDLGENIGGINILNRPDAIWNSAGYDGWIISHNMPWIKRVVSRSDEVYLATSPNDLNKLMWTKFNGADVPTISAYELRELVIGNLKPVNISSQKWSEIQTIVQQMESNNLFINY